MKILTIIDSYGAGGAQNQLSHVATGLKQKGHDVHSFQYFDDNFFAHRLESANIKQHVIIKKGKLGINVIKSLADLYTREKFDVALSYMDTPNFYAAAALKMARHNPALVVSHRMSTDIPALSPIMRQILRWTNKQANAVICNSFHERDNWLRDQPGLPAHTIYNGIEDPIGSQSTNKQTPPDGFTDPQAHLPTLLAVGTVTERKNADVVVQAMSDLQKNDSLNFKLVWLGEPKANLPADVQYQSRINSLIESLKLNGHWHWAGQQADTAGFYQYADALIHASLKEGLPNVICEAQMAALPVFVSDVLDHRKMIVDGESGFCFDPDNPTQLAQMLHNYFDKSPADRKTHNESARASALNLFQLENCVTQYESVFSQLV